MGSITEKPQPPQLLRLPLMSRILLSENASELKQGLEKEKGWGRHVCGGDRERNKTQQRDDKHVQLVRPSMINFAKTDAELRPGYALLILATYKRIKKHLLSNWRAWINHRAILKGTLSSLSWQTWQFSLKWQMSTIERGPPAPSLSALLTYLPWQIQQRTMKKGFVAEIILHWRSYISYKKKERDECDAGIAPSLCFMPTS